MTKMNKIFGLATATALALSAASCSEDTMDRINVDNAHPAAEVVDAKYQVTDAIVASVYSTNCGMFSWYASIFTEQTFGTANNQAKNAELRNVNETAAASTYDNEWNSTYLNLNNIKQMIEKCEEGGKSAGQDDIKAVGQILEAYNWGILTDLFGDIPCSEALNGDSTSSPKIDKQEDIYKLIFQLLDSAIATIDSYDGANNMGSQDVLYAGNTQKWQALAYALKARYQLHILGRAADKDAQLRLVKESAQKAEALGFQGADLDIFTGYASGATNPWTAYWLSRDYIGSTTTVDNLLLSREHPFEPYYNCDLYGNEDVATLATPGDEALATETYAVNCPYWLYTGYIGKVSAHLFSASELFFILAEAQARLGEDATVAFNAAVTASFKDLATSTLEDDLISAYPDLAYQYLEGPTAEKFQANPLSEILTQKYIAQMRDEQVETYCDMRRCRYIDGSYPVAMVNPKNTNSAGANRWPLRFPYGSSDVTSNPNVTSAFGSGNDAGMYIFTENVWWAGGSR